MAKKRVHSEEFKRMCVARMEQTDDIRALARELEVHRRLLYRWRQQLSPVKRSQGRAPESLREATLRKEVSRLKQVLADKTLELDFFKGALQKVEARRQQQSAAGAQASTTKSGK